MASKKQHIKAAESALGLEPVGLETRAEAELRQQWERRFAPLGLVVPEARPPEDMLYRILRGLDDVENAKTLRRVKTGRNLWRGAALAATALAAGLAYFAVTPVLEAPPAEPVPAPAARYVAVVTPQGTESSLIVEVDLQAGTALVRPVGISVEEGKALELWRLAPEAAPESLGLIPPDGAERIDVSAEPGDGFAVSLEPEGGSPTGAPTGPVLYSGTLVAVPE